MDITYLRSKLLANLPPAFGREAIENLLPGIYTRETLANLDAKGEGPMRFGPIGRRVVYERDSFVDWFISRANDFPADIPERLAFGKRTKRQAKGGAE